MLKAGGGDLESKLEMVLSRYNKTYPSAIKCTPEEAWKNETRIARIENVSIGSYTKRFKPRAKENFVVGQKVRISRKENLGSAIMNEMGRFLREGKIIAQCGDDAYLINERGKIIKKCHYDLKGK